MAVVNKYKHVMTENSVYIGRGSKWGNPYRIGIDGNRDTVCDKHKQYLWDQVQRGDITLQELVELDGKDLVCFCAPQRCHGDTLILAIMWAKDQIKNKSKG